MLETGWLLALIQPNPDARSISYRHDP